MARRYTLKELDQFSATMAKKLAQAQGTPRYDHPAYSDIKNHPKCSKPGCINPRIVMDYHWTSGAPVYRPVCNQHHLERIAERNGHKTHQAFLNSRHPYRQHRLDYCENRDGRLGFKCNYTIQTPAQLQVDHCNGDPTDNRPQNLQTLCACCHIYKTHVNRDYATPGRKFFGVTY